MKILDFLETKQIENKDIDHIRTIKPLSNSEIDELYVYFRKHHFFNKHYDFVKKYHTDSLKMSEEMGDTKYYATTKIYFVFYCLFILQQANEFIENYNNSNFVYDRLESISRDWLDYCPTIRWYDEQWYDLEESEIFERLDDLEKCEIFIPEYVFFNTVIDLINEMITNYSEWNLPSPDDNFMILIKDRIDEIKECNQEYFYSEEDDLKEKLQRAHEEIELSKSMLPKKYTTDTPNGIGKQPPQTAI